MSPDFKWKFDFVEVNRQNGNCRPLLENGARGALIKVHALLTNVDGTPIVVVRKRTTMSSLTRMS